MKLSYLLNKFKFLFIPGGYKRGAFLRKKGLMKGCGENIFYQPRIMPGEPHLLKFHNNISIASGVTFVTHDVMQKVFNRIEEKSTDFHMGCIEVKSNVFIGANSIILPNVRIGENCIVAAGSVVTKDVPDGSVVAGVPAKVIGSFERVRISRIKEATSRNHLDRDEIIKELWEEFYKSRE